MNKRERIKKYGIISYKKHSEQTRKWAILNKDRVRELAHSANRKGGLLYEKRQKENKTGLRGQRCRIRAKHRYTWGQYKKIIAPQSQLHHEWIPDTSEYHGVALVETDAHMHGYIDVIEILEGVIRVLTEKELCEGTGEIP